MENMVKSHKNTKSGLTRAEEEWIMVPLFKKNTKLTKASETHDRVSDAFFSAAFTQGDAVGKGG